MRVVGRANPGFVVFVAAQVQRGFLLALAQSPSAPHKLTLLVALRVVKRVSNLNLKYLLLQLVSVVLNFIDVSLRYLLGLLDGLFGPLLEFLYRFYEGSIVQRVVSALPKLLRAIVLVPADRVK